MSGPPGTGMPYLLKAPAFMGQDGPKPRAVRRKFLKQEFAKREFLKRMAGKQISTRQTGRSRVSIMTAYLCRRSPSGWLRHQARS